MGGKTSLFQLPFKGSFLKESVFTLFMSAASAVILGGKEAAGCVEEGPGPR